MRRVRVVRRTWRLGSFRHAVTCGIRGSTTLAYLTHMSDSVKTMLVLMFGPGLAFNSFPKAGIMRLAWLSCCKQSLPSTATLTACILGVGWNVSWGGWLVCVCVEGIMGGGEVVPPQLLPELLWNMILCSIRNIRLLMPAGHKSPASPSRKIYLNSFSSSILEMGVCSAAKRAVCSCLSDSFSRQVAHLVIASWHCFSSVLSLPVSSTRRSSITGMSSAPTVTPDVPCSGSSSVSCRVAQASRGMQSTVLHSTRSTCCRVYHPSCTHQ